MSKATKPAQKPKATKPAPAKFVVTQEYLDANPDLDLEVGDEIEIPAAEEKKHYEEWKCEIKAIVEEGKVTGKNVEKLKLMRACVKITDEEADVLNAGVKDGSNSIVSMYFKAQ